MHEGRTVYDNIRKVIAWTLPTNGGEALTVIVAMLFGLALPMTAVQILWINMVTAVTLGLALAFEPAEPGVMRRPPRRPDAPLLSPFMLWRIGSSRCCSPPASSACSLGAPSAGCDVRPARTMVVNALVVMEIFYLFNVRYLHMTSFTCAARSARRRCCGRSARWSLAQFAFTYAPWMQALFQTGPVPLADGLLIVATGVAMMVVLELEKALLRRLGWFADDGPGSRHERRSRDARSRMESRRAAPRAPGH